MEFENEKSQDLYNTACLLNTKDRKIEMVKGAYYKLNLQEKSVTKEIGFSHKINISYRKYQIKSLKNGNFKIARIFALKRINNSKYLEWLKNNKGKEFYIYQKQKS